MKTKYNKKIA